MSLSAVTDGVIGLATCAAAGPVDVPDAMLSAREKNPSSFGMR